MLRVPYFEEKTISLSTDFFKDDTQNIHIFLLALYKQPHPWCNDNSGRPEGASSWSRATSPQVNNYTIIICCLSIKHT